MEEKGRLRLHPRFVQCKSRPVGYVGWYCAVACWDCDKEWLSDFLNQLYYVYAKDPENLLLQEWQKSKKKKTCRFLFISFPAGDQPLITFVMSQFNLIVGHWQGDPMNANRLTKAKKDEITLHMVYETLMECYQSKDYDRIGHIIESRVATSRAEDSGFYLFMCLLGLTRLIWTKGPGKHDERVLGVDKYLFFHEYHNGRDSKQYAQALLLRIFCLGEAHPFAANDLSDATAILGENDCLLNLLCGHFAMSRKEYDRAVSCYDKAAYFHYPEITPRLADAGLWQHAWRFIKGAYNQNPNQETKTRLAQCLYALGEKHNAIGLVGAPERGVLKTWTKSEYRICRFCRATAPVEIMTRCNTCRDTYYCHSACYATDMVDHREKDCRYCRSCKELIPAWKRRLRCAACWTTFYCSAECQNHDWFEGDHKSTCGK